MNSRMNKRDIQKTHLKKALAAMFLLNQRVAGHSAMVMPCHHKMLHPHTLKKVFAIHYLINDRKCYEREEGKERKGEKMLGRSC